MSPAPRWYCSSNPLDNQYQSCRDLPCAGHRISRKHRDIAEAMAWIDGWSPDQAADFEHSWPNYYRLAAQFMSERGVPS